MVTIYNFSKKATLSLLKTKLIWSKDYKVIISAYDVTNKILSLGSSNLADMVSD